MKYLLIEICLPFQHGIEVIGLIRALFRTKEIHPQDVSDDLLQRESVFLIHSQQEEGQHDDHHADDRCADADMGLEQKEKRDADCGSASETDQLSFGQIEHDLCFYRGQVLGYRYIGHSSSPPSMGRKDRLAETAGFQQREAQQHRIAHASPYRFGDAAVHRDVFYQDRVDRYTDDN